MKVLVVKTSSLGDIIHSLPALTDAACAIPGIAFDWVVEEAFAEVPGWHINVDNTIPIAVRRWRKQIIKSIISGEWQTYKQQLQRIQYDAVIDAQGLFKSAFFATRLAKGKSYGLDYHSAREPLASLFYDQKLAIPKGQHAVERVRQLFAKVLDYQVPETIGDYGISNHFIPVTWHEPSYLVFIHSTTRLAKHWPERYWEALIDHSVAAGWHIKLPWGNERELSRAKRLAGNHDTVEVLPQMNLTDIAYTLLQASAIVSVDTGLCHLAAAVGQPTITLYGATDPRLIGGYGLNQHHLIASNYPDIAASGNIQPQIFANLTPSIVWDKLRTLLQ